MRSGLVLVMILAAGLASGCGSSREPEQTLTDKEYRDKMEQLTKEAESENAKFRSKKTTR